MDTKMTKQRLTDEFESLRKRLVKVEGQIGETLSEATDSAVRRIRKKIGQEPIDDAQREHLIRTLAELKSRRRGDDQAISHWLESEEEVDLLLKTLGLRD